jgi:enoyl-CoA hydratase/carnithine racemase
MRASRRLLQQAAAAAASPASDAPLLLARNGALQTVTLNRPKAFNAIDSDAVRRLAAGLAGWSQDPAVAAVLLRGAGGKAFCAGGDVKALASGSRDEQDWFFRNEYRLDYELALNGQRQPHVVLYDGAVMGGGVGISIHAEVRAASEKAVFAMPETAIGFLPDVGGSFFLPRLPKRFGHYLGLTGARLVGPEVVHAGVATHYIPRDKLPAFEAALVDALDAAAAAARAAGGARVEPAAALDVVNTVADAHAVPQDDLPEWGLSVEALQLIEWAFGQPSVEAVVHALQDHVAVSPQPIGAAAAPPGSARDVALKALDTLSRVSPLALKVTHAQLARGGSMDLRECFAMELRLATRMLAQPDFYEGVRALLVDKDNKPRWTPSSLGEVRPADVEAMFAPLPPHKELRLDATAGAPEFD